MPTSPTPSPPSSLLALLLDCTPEQAAHLLDSIGGLEKLTHLSAQALNSQTHLTERQRVQVLALANLAQQIAALPPPARPLIRSAADAAALMHDMAELPQEQVRVILLDSSRHVIAIATLYIGTVNGSVVRVAEVFRDAIVRGAPALILVHNHPSGDPSPSPEDVELTRNLVIAGRLLDIHVVDHLIIGRGAWASLREQALM